METYQENSEILISVINKICHMKLKLLKSNDNQESNTEKYNNIYITTQHNNSNIIEEENYMTLQTTSYTDKKKAIAPLDHVIITEDTRGSQHAINIKNLNEDFIKKLCNHTDISNITTDFTFHITSDNTIWDLTLINKINTKKMLKIHTNIEPNNQSSETYTLNEKN